MPNKFVVVNNGMTELRGHYLETGLAIAREAQRLGYDTALAAHARCPGSAFPSDIPFYPLFRLDHWASKVDREAPGLFGLRANLKALRATPIEAVLDGRVSMREYLESRFEPLPPEPVASAPPLPPPPTPSRRHRFKHTLRSWLPPVVAQPLKWVYRQRYLARLAVRAVTPPAIYNRAKAGWHARRRPAPAPAAVPSPPPPAPAEVAPRPAAPPGAVDEAAIDRFLREALAHIPDGMSEYEYSRVYAEDLERFLCLAGVGPGDHVFLPTAHGREAYAIARLITTLGPDQSPTFHLEFRHGLVTLDELDTGVTAENPAVLRYTRVHRAFFDACRGYPAADAIRFYADTAELSDDHAALAGFPFRELPIPFRADLIPPAPPRTGPLTVMFLGDVRMEKGFHLIPGLIRDVYDDYVKPGKVRFVIQGSLHQDEGHRELRDAVAELSAYPPEEVCLPGRAGFIKAEEYYRLLSEADIVLCPYDRVAYRARSSGVLAEAVTAGKPTVVTAGTWLARQQLPGSGEAFTDAESFARALVRVIDDYPAYHERAKVARGQWVAWHTTANLLDQLVGPRAAVRAAVA